MFPPLLGAVLVAKQNSELGAVEREGPDDDCVGYLGFIFLKLLWIRSQN